MTLRILVIIVTSFVYICNSQTEDGVLCSARACSDYIDNNPCPTIEDECLIQNSTFNGMILPSPDPCNCCTFCLVNLNKGDYCSMGDVSSTVPDSICGPGLTCGGDSTCIEMVDNTECIIKRNDYDLRRAAGKLGTLEIRPLCDADGYYEPNVCIPEQNCFCVNANGERIFGEIPYSNMASLTMKCGCSRKYELSKLFLNLDVFHPNQFFRCVDNGDYDTIQCIGDSCMCTDAADGAPTFPTDPFVNISLISNTTLKDCFDRTGKHLEGAYYYSCAAKYLKVLEIIEDYKTEDGFNTVFNIDLPSCDPNGRYSPVQKSGDLKICVDWEGNPISNYNQSSSITEVEIDCHCARTHLLIPDALEKPDCCSNGNFNQVQCRRGTCYCVDKNGMQVVVEDAVNEIDAFNKHQLHCFESACK